MSEKITLAEFEFDTTAIEKAKEENVKLKKEMIEVRREQSELNKVIKQSGTVTDAQAKKLSENDEKLKTLNTSYINNSKAIQANASSTKNLTKILNEEVKTETQAINSNKKLIQARKGLDQSTKEGRKQVALLNQKIDLNNKFIDASADKYSAQKRNIGNYGSALQGLIPLNNTYINNLSMMKKGYDAQVIGLKASGKGLKAFRIALIATGIGAFVVIIGTLITAFLKTQKGIDAVTKILTPLRVVMESLWGVVEGLGTSLVDAFENPKQAIKDLWGLIKTNFINRFEGMGGMLKNFGELLESIWNPDIDTDEVWDDLQNNIGKATLGVDDIKGKWKEAGDMMSEAYDRGKQIADLDIEISKAESEIALKRERNLNLIREAELITKDKSKSQAEINKALAEAERLTKENLNDENAIIQMKIKKMKLEQKSNDTSREQLKELNELEAQIEINKGKARGIELRFLGAKNRMQRENSVEYKKQLQEEAKKQKEYHDEVLKNLETELNLFKAQNTDKLNSDKELNETILNGQLAVYEEIARQRREIAKREREFDKLNEQEYKLELLNIENEYQANRKAVLDEYKQQQKEQHQADKEAEREEKTLDFELELERLQLEKDSIYEQELLNYERDKQLLNQKHEDGKLSQAQYNKALENLETEHAQNIEYINEVLEENKVQLAADAFGNVANIVGKHTALGKVAAVAQTTMDTYQSATAAYKSLAGIPVYGPALGALAAASAVASGLANVRKIMSTKKPTIPKAEKGALFNIGGKRHSNGGTQFYGDDGTRFEAEKGEVLGVMSRNASKHFMAFNNLYTSGIGRTKNYLADGGIVKRNLELPVQEKIKVYNVVQDTFDVMDNDVVQVENIANH